MSVTTRRMFMMLQWHLKVCVFGYEKVGKLRYFWPGVRPCARTVLSTGFLFPIADTLAINTVALLRRAHHFMPAVSRAAEGNYLNIQVAHASLPSPPPGHLGTTSTRMTRQKRNFRYCWRGG